MPIGPAAVGVDGSPAASSAEPKPAAF